MSLLRRIERNRLPRPGEQVKIFQNGHVIARGQVISVDHQSVTIAGKSLIDLDTAELRRGLSDGSVRIEQDNP